MKLPPLWLCVVVFLACVAANIVSFAHQPPTIVSEVVSTTGGKWLVETRGFMRCGVPTGNDEWTAVCAWSIFGAALSLAGAASHLPWKKWSAE